MRKLTLVVLFATLIISGLNRSHAVGIQNNAITKVEAAEGWQLLFDGRTLKGWRMTTPGSWKVEDSAIAIEKEIGMGPEGMIWTIQQYGDFILESDFKISAKCNSGIFFRVSDTKDPVQTGFEMQVNDAFARPKHPSGPAHNCGALYGIVAPSHNLAKPAGEWNHAVIMCKASIISILLNGDQVVSTVDLDQYTEPNKNTDGTPNKFNRPLKDFAREGYIGFQQHGGGVWYRNIKMKRL